MVGVNLLGLLYCSHAALPHLLRAAEGDPRGVADVVNISSVAGRVARDGSGVYNATKHGVGAFSESLRQELAGRHVRVSLVEPGAVDNSCRATIGRRSGSGSARRSPGSNGSRPPISRTRSRISSRARATSPSTKCSFAPPSRSGRNPSSSGRSSDRMLATPSPHQPARPRRLARRPESVLRRTGQLHVSANVPV
jgi:NAD(P)-dependent dehydrogenase (short-subunit alcohol dehydrogenase family)